MEIKFPQLRFSFLLLFSFVLIASSTGLAQTDEKDRLQQQTEKRQDLERKTLAMLDEVATQALSLKLSENRSFVLAATADLMWKHDEKRARSLFWDALNSLTSANNSNIEELKESAARSAASKETPAKRSTTEKTRDLNQYYEMFSQRQEFLRKVAARDPQLAMDMLRATRLTPPDYQQNAGYHLPDDRDLEQEIANQTAARDPKRALQLARESLAKGLTFQVFGILLQLNEKSPEAAQEFAGDVIDKIQTSNVATDTTAFGMAMMLLQYTRPAPAADENTASLSSGRIKLSDDQRRALVYILTDAVDDATANSNLLLGIMGVMSDIEQLAPDRAAKVKAKFATRAPNEQRQWGQLDSLFNKGTPEDLIKAGAAANDQLRNSYFQAAIGKAVMNGKAEALREFIKSQVTDEAQRKSLNDLLDEQQMNWSLSHGDIEEVQKQLPSIRLKEKRALALAEIAMMLEKKGQHDEALKLLDEAQTMVKLDLTSQSQSEALLAVLLADAIIDPDRAFTAIEPIIDRANDNLGKLLLLDKLIKSGFVKDGEIKLQHSGIISADFAVFKYGKGVVALANADFNRTKSLTDRLQRNELRVMARLLMVQSLMRSGEPSEKNSAQ